MSKGHTLEQLMKMLSKSVIGQEAYLKKIAVTVWLHNRRIEATEHSFSEINLQKHNLLCVGPTGSGKTLAVSILARLYGLDVMIADMSSYTGTGWKGKDIEEMIKELYVSCGKNKFRTEKAIIVMDELDKMVLQKDSHEPSFATENSLLKIMEGTKVTVDKDVIDTRNILFIGAGAFEGIESLVKKRVNTGKMGFKPEREAYVVKEEELITQIERRDVITYGMGTQLMGRFSDIAVLRKLNQKDFKTILLESDASVVKSLNKTLRLSCGIDVEMDEAGAEAVAKLAVIEQTGARGLAQIILPVIDDVLFIVDDDSTVNGILITSNEDGEPIVKLKEGERHQRVNLSARIPYSFPHPERKNVEHFCWNVLAPYLNANTENYTTIRAMHQLLCSIVFFVLRRCNPDEHTLVSLQKLARESNPQPESKQTVYEFLMRNEGADMEVCDYYRSFKMADPNFETVSVLQKALNKFSKNSYLMKSNSI